MPDFIYQIKCKREGGGWDWPPLYSDLITANSSKHARELLELEYGTKLPGGSLKKGAETQQLLCTIKELTDANSYLRQWFEVRQCLSCQKQYRIIEKYQYGNEGGSQAYCSYKCQRENDTVQFYQREADFNMSGTHAPVIYKITNKISGQSYVGKTTQAFTLRWYQHFFQGKKGTKFYEAIKASSVADWTFEIMEIVRIPEGVTTKVDMEDYIFSREMHWIKQYNCLDGGYNSVASRAEEIEENNLQAKLFEDSI